MMDNLLQFSFYISHLIKSLPWFVSILARLYDYSLIQFLCDIYIKFNTLLLQYCIHNLSNHVYLPEFKSFQGDLMIFPNIDFCFAFESRFLLLLLLQFYGYYPHLVVFDKKRVNSVIYLPYLFY